MAEVFLPPTAPTASVKPKPIIKEEFISLDTENGTAFDPEKHLSYVVQPKVLSLQDISLPEDVGISPVAFSEPFPLFTEEAIRIMRGEIFGSDVWKNCLQSSDFASCQLRGHCPKYAPFMYDAWKDPKTLSIVSNITGIDLIPVMDIEIGSINISVQQPREGKTGESEDDAANLEDFPVTKWHYDSYPFVCVVMMSDASAMIGGETAVRTGSGEIRKLRGPQMGCAVVLQGRCINHQALSAVGGVERITMVTAFRPRDPFILEDSVLTTIRPISNLSDLYFQWTEYRVEVLQDRLRGMMKVLGEQHRANKTTDIKRIKTFLRQQEEWLAVTNDEIQEL